MGMDAEDDPKYQITDKDSHIIKAFQTMSRFHCLDYNVYRRNPAWFNSALYALVKTEIKAAEDKKE